MDYITKGLPLNKDRLALLSIDDCPRCEHSTLQARLSSDWVYTCLNCGGVITSEKVIK